MADWARRARRLTAAAVLAACGVTPAGAVNAPVSLSVAPSARLPAGAQVRLTASARLVPGARIRITAQTARLAECTRSPCVATYRGRGGANIRFRAVVVSAGKVQSTSRLVTVRWAAAAPVGTVGGDYAGHTTQNEPISFTVADDRTITRVLVGRLNEACVYPDGTRVGRVAGNTGSVAGSWPIADDGTFVILLSGPTIVGSVDSAFRITIAGRFRGGTAVGSIREDVAAPDAPKLSCTTGDQSWVAQRVEES